MHYFVAKILAQRSRSYKVHFSPKMFFEMAINPGQFEEAHACFRLELNQNVDIAVDLGSSMQI